MPKLKISPFAGVRVELSPALDLWMRGARFGTIRNIDQKTGIATVAMDHPQVKRLQKIRIMDLTVYAARLKLLPEGQISAGAWLMVHDALAERFQVSAWAPSDLNFKGKVWIEPNDLKRE